MPADLPREDFEPLFEPQAYSRDDEWQLRPFFTNLDRSVYVPLIFSPEVIGALCSRTSRAADDLRMVFLREYLAPFLEPQQGPKETEDEWRDRLQYGAEVDALIRFLHEHPLETMFSNPRARSFYVKWLAQYGDDSIAQMAGTHLVFGSLSQVAIKHFEDQRIGLAPIEKSTRYVNYAEKIRGHYRYYTDPTLAVLGLADAYRSAMDHAFATYEQLLPRLTAWLHERFPNEKLSVVEKKAFDTLRGLLPMATLSQVSFYGNGQAFEYLINRASRHHLGEIRWAAERAYEELSLVIPSLLRRIKNPDSADLVRNYQDYLAGHSTRMEPLARAPAMQVGKHPDAAMTVNLVEYDPEGQEKILAGLLYEATENHAPWTEMLNRVRAMSPSEQRAVLDAGLAGRTERWQKVPRAFEHAYVRFEIVMNIGAWRDLHRHRMLTQQRQMFSCRHGYDIPEDVVAAGLDREFREAVERVAEIHERIAAKDPYLAQYAVTLAHRVRFLQWENLRQCFWEMELRTIPEGHPDYRAIEQAKFRCLEKAYPLIAERMRVNLGSYDFARRGQEEKIQARLRELSAVRASRPSP